MLAEQCIIRDLNMDTLNIFSVALGIAGLAGTIYFGFKSIYLQRKLDDSNGMMLKSAYGISTKKYPDGFVRN